MDTIIGLGGAGCNIARCFSSYPQYKVYLLDDEPSDEKRYFEFKKCKNIEDYENNTPSVKRFFSRISKECLVVLCGASNVTAATLSLLQQIHHRSKINILYVQPDASLLSDDKKLLERTVRHVLQEYTRSGVFGKMFIVSNEQIESFMDEVPLREYHQELNKFIVGAFHSINVFNHINSVLDTFSEPDNRCRICSFGILDVDTGGEKMFFSLDRPTEIRYYYCVPETHIEEDKTLRKKIIKQVKEKSINNLKISYGIYSTEYEEQYGYVVSYSSQIQTEENI